MRRLHTTHFCVPKGRSGRRLILSGSLLVIAALAGPGCGHHSEHSDHSSAIKPPAVKLIQPELRTITRVVGQPSFIESYERTSVFPKLTGYIEKWNVDIGDKVKKGEVMAKLFMPELVEDFETKKATVELREQKVKLARTVVEVASADVEAAKARLEETNAILDKFESEVERWKSEVDRLKKEVSRGVVDPQVLLESTNQWKSAIAYREAAKASIDKAKAELLSKQASYDKAKVDVDVCLADLSVAISDAKRIEAWVGYIDLPAPYDGVVVGRNANTGDFVMPASGDPTANQRSPYLSPGKSSAPIYVVDRTDIVRIYVDVPEQDANYVQIGTKASVLVQAYRDEPIPCSVTRTSWALNIKSRTLRAEIDLPNPNSQLLPGMYGYAKVIIKRPEVRALPLAAITRFGDKTYCWIYKDGHAERKEVRTGVNDGSWVEIIGMQQQISSNEHEHWIPVNGSEQVIMADLSSLAEGEPVSVAEIATEPPAPQVEHGQKGAIASHPHVKSVLATPTAHVHEAPQPSRTDDRK